MLLNKHVADSDGTVIYLKIMDFLIMAYMNPNKTPIERIYCNWTAVFLLRIWRCWLQRQNYKLENNFISSNCYACIELNAHTLIQCIITLKERDASDLFIVGLFNSQCCESTFRQLRSISTTFSTVVNCSVLDFMNRIKKIQLQADIVYNDKNELEFPRIAQKSTKFVSYPLPSVQEICYTVDKAKYDATAMLNEFGVFIDDELIAKCYVPNARPMIEDEIDDEDENDDIIEQGNFKAQQIRLFFDFLYFLFFIICILQSFQKCIFCVSFFLLFCIPYLNIIYIDD